MSYMGEDPGDLTPEQMWGRDAVETDRATCTICDGNGCNYCLGRGVEQTREDFERYDEQADGALDLRLVEDTPDDFNY